MPDGLTQSDIARVHDTIAPYIRHTPVLNVNGSDVGVGSFSLTLKLEFTQRAGSFKARGAFANLLTRPIPAAGVVAASGGNHGVAVAYAARRLRIPAKIFVPTVASPVKVARIRACGADVVIGGSIPAAIAADWLVTAWDQNAQMFVMSPIAAVVEQIVSEWLKELFGLPATWSVGFVTGAQMANFTSLLTARHQLLRQMDWDVERHGLFGAPPIEVVVSDESHRTIFTALRMLGLGAERVRRVDTDTQGRMRPDRLEQILRGESGPCIVCAQIGNVNTGALIPSTISRYSRANVAPGSMLTRHSACGLRRVTHDAI